jgi:type IV pilus assembly protein PilX
MNRKYLLPNNEKGSVIVAALLILALLTIIGMAASSTSTTEQHLATNTLLYERAFYAAEAGFEHAKGALKVPYNEQNQANIALGNPGSWSFVLNGSGVIPGLAAATDCSFAGGVELLTAQLDGISYTVTVWNNSDTGDMMAPCDAEVDNDGRMMIRTVATGPRGSVCSIESLIEGTTDSGGMEGYKAQAGAGAGKSYRNNDLESITDLSNQQM